MQVLNRSESKMKKGIFISIKPKYTKLILSGEKNYEFRSFIPKKKFELLYVYETTPTCELKYIITIDKILTYPEKIKEAGYGNEEYNKGLKRRKNAYHIKSVEKLLEPIPLKQLKEEFNFTAPQGFSYGEHYSKLVKYINESKRKRIK